MLFINIIVFSQEYPSWFLNKPKNEYKYYCGMVRTEYHKDLSFTSALKNAALNATINKSISYKLDNIYMSVAGEKSWVDTQGKAQIDTSLVQYYYNSLFLADSFQTNLFTFVLASETNHKFKCQSINIASVPQPEWVENIPRSNNYRYSVGISESYYHDTESWENAVENARIELAKESRIKSRQIQKKLDSQYTDIVRETTTTIVSEVEIISRWIDTKTKLHYVLIRSQLK